VGSAVNGVYAPPSVASYADSVTSSAASAIHNVIYELLDEAADLERRAACCCADQATSMPVPALMGLAFGGAALGGASQVQAASAVSPVAAFGPGVATPAPVPVFNPAPAVAAPVAVAAAPAPMSLHQALANGTYGGSTTSSVGAGISLVWDPGYNLNATSGVGMVYDPSSIQAQAVGVSPSVLAGMRGGSDLGVSVGVGLFNDATRATIARNIALTNPPIDIYQGSWEIRTY
jgi:hypothetical protein